MQSTNNAPFGSGRSFAVMAFALAGLLYSPLFFAGAILVSGLAIAKRHTPSGYGIAVLGLIYFLVILGFGLGEDMAKRDNARSDSSSPRSQ